ncbi:MAG: transposase [Gemmatimonadetes bacterium]|nr:transposase [Gemmatimonadota bacterium]
MSRRWASRKPVTAPHSPWQNPYCERLIGSMRRECLDHVIVLGERHLMRVLRSYASYYHGSRTHRSLDDDCPDPRGVEPPEMGDIVALAQVGGLHHRYTRRLAASPSPQSLLPSPPPHPRGGTPLPGCAGPNRHTPR